MPDKVIHEIRLNQYSAVPADRTRRFSLGTSDSYGVEQLRIVQGEGWDGLTITATFHPPEGEAVQVLVPDDGLIDVPPEATRSGSELPLKYGKIVFAGVADGMQRISCNLPYTVLDHAPVEGAESSGPAPSWYEQAAAHFLPSGGKAGQVLAKASDADLDVEWADGGNGTADHAKLSNRDASDQHPISAITGLETALDAKQPAGSYLTQESDPTVPDWAKQPEKPSYTADEVGALSAATLPEAITTALAQATASGAFDGADGQDGITPTIGENGNWYLGETDTGKPSRGETGPAGADGRDGADGQPGENGTDGYSPTANVTQTDNGATITITDKNGTTTATVTNGKDGADGNPGADGRPGNDGADGKSAYQYAVDGGYTGTEEEFAAKLAEEMPDKLPNPNALTFTGAVEGSYDGSVPLNVEIPRGGGGNRGWTLLYDGTITIEEAVKTVTVSLLAPCDGMVDFIGHIIWTANANTEKDNDNISIRVGKAYMNYGRIGDASNAGNAVFQATVTSTRTYWGRAFAGNNLQFNITNMQYGFSGIVKNPDYENVTIESFSKTYAGTITLQLYGR